DQALCRFGELLKGSLRADDRAGRWGGEEFVVLLVGTLATPAVDWVNRLRARMTNDLGASDLPPFTSSFGIADSSMARDPAALMPIAETALYIAKNDGRDRGSIGRADYALEPDRPARPTDEPAPADESERQFSSTRG